MNRRTFVSMLGGGLAGLNARSLLAQTNVPTASNPAASGQNPTAGPTVDGQNPAFTDLKIQAEAEPFDLSEVRILGGICKTNQDLDAKYILWLDPDRLLHTFRINANLPSTAKPLGGWEAPGEGFRGQFMGHYLTACAEMYAATGDKQLLDRGTYLATELGKCQDALGTGYLSAFPVDAFDTLETKFTSKNVVPYYVMHKIMAGLLDQYHYCGNQQALAIVIKMADYFQARMTKLTPDDIEKVLRTGGGPRPHNEFGGMSEVLHNLYAITKKQEYLDFADVFDRPWFVGMLAAGQDQLAGLHVNTHIPQVVGFARHYELTGDDSYQRAADYFWSQVTEHHTYVTGSLSNHETFMKPDMEGNGLSIATGESCCSYNMLKLTEHIFTWKASSAVADYYERALYNHILGSIDPDTGMTTYYLSFEPGHFRTYGTPDTSFWCCNGTGVENHAKYGTAIYYHHADTLWVNLFIPSQLTWTERGITVTQNTTFPESDETSLTITAAQATKWKMLLRVPYWTKGAVVKINDVVQEVEASPNGYVTLDRTWQTGDKVDFKLPMALHLHRPKDDPNMVAIMYGPLVLAGDLGHENMPASDNVRTHTEFYKDPCPPVPSLSGDSNNLDSWIKPVAGQALAFTTINAGKPNEVKLEPLYGIHHDRYSVYWKFSDSTQKSAVN